MHQNLNLECFLDTNTSHIIYSWRGKKCTQENVKNLENQAAHVANQLQGKIMQISIGQGLEPQHFIKMFSGKMTVFFSEKMKFSKTDCFLVKFGNVYAYIPDPKESCIIYSSEVHLFLNN